MSFDCNTYNLSLPESSGIVPVEVFEELEYEFRGDSYATTWDLNPRQAKSDPLLRILSRYTHKLINHIEESGGVVPNKLHHTVSTESIAPSRAQRMAARNWHVDARYNTPQSVVLSAASNLPTEFLVANDDGCPSENVSKQRSELLDEAAGEFNFTSGVIQRGIDDGILDIYLPAKREAVINYARIHRSPRNDTDSSIPRVWFGIVARLGDD